MNIKYVICFVFFIGLVSKLTTGEEPSVQKGFQFKDLLSNDGENSTGGARNPENNAAAGNTGIPDDLLHGRCVEAKGAFLYVLVPESSKADDLWLVVVLDNRSKETFRCLENGFILSSKVTITAENGQKVTYTTPGKHRLDWDQSDGKSFDIELLPKRTFLWRCNLSDAFEPMKPGKYNLTFETKVFSKEPNTGEFSKKSPLVTEVPFVIR